MSNVLNVSETDKTQKINDNSMHIVGFCVVVKGESGD